MASDQLTTTLTYDDCREILTALHNAESKLTDQYCHCRGRSAYVEWNDDLCRRRLANIRHAYQVIRKIYE